MYVNAVSGLRRILGEGGGVANKCGESGSEDAKSRRKQLANEQQWQR